MASSTRALPAFEVSKVGLGKLLARRGGKTRAVAELIQNSWDEAVTQVSVALTSVAGRRQTYQLVVEDDAPDGFVDLSHAYTLFAESAKKRDPTRRGRFNMGEKMVVALCSEAEISSVTGTIVFTGDGRRHFPRRKRECGSRFSGILAMTRGEAQECAAAMRRLIPPTGVATFFNGELLPARTPALSFQATIETEQADDDGNLRRCQRRTTVSLHEPSDGERPTIYELGIPVVELAGDDRWHIDVAQKVPLSLERDNVRPAYLRALRAEVMNHAGELLREDDADARWLDDAMTDKRAESGALGRTLDLRFGEKRVVFDPNDTEANHRAVAAGFTVIAPRGLPKGVSAKARELGLVKVAGEVTPSPRPYSNDPDAPVRRELPKSEWTEGMRNIAEYTETLALRLLDVAINVAMVDDPECRNFRAAYGRGQFDFNVRVLGRKWFNQGPSDEVNALTIHELGHHYEGNHLSEGYYDALCSIGAKLARLALEDPDFFSRFAPAQAAAELPASASA
jgi:hypothetical protein